MPTHSFHLHEPTHNPHHHPHLLDVVLVAANSQRYESRYRLFKEAEKRMLATPGVRLTVVELAFAHRPHHLSHPENVRHLLLRNPDELWHKENLINLGVARLPEDWKYVAWVDADLTFLDPRWATETVEALQHYQVIQPWSHCHDLGPNCESLQVQTSFLSVYASHRDLSPNRRAYVGFPHSGFAWAARREAWDHLGGLIDTAILGAADHHMAGALIGKAEMTIHKGMTQGYRKPILHWQHRALKYVKKNLGYLPGTIIHHWHGKKRDRRYHERWKILVDNRFNPATDLTRDWQNLWRLKTETARQERLRDGLREYMGSRNEDSIDV